MFKGASEGLCTVMFFEVNSPNCTEPKSNLDSFVRAGFVRAALTWMRSLKRLKLTEIVSLISVFPLLPKFSQIFLNFNFFLFSPEEKILVGYESIVTANYVVVSHEIELVNK